MATPLKKERKFSLTFSGIKNFSLNVWTFFRTRFLLAAFAGVSVFVVALIFFTAIFNIKSAEYSFKDFSNDCISRESIEKYYFKKNVKIWGYLFFDEAALKPRYACLDKIVFHWNPFTFNVIKVEVFAARPVAQMTVSRVDSNNLTGGSEQFFNAPVLSEEVKFLTSEGNLINLVATPALPKFRIRIFRDQKIEQLHFPVKNIETLLQLNAYQEREFNASDTIDVLQDGTVRFKTQFAEEIYVTLHDDLSIQLGSLQAILRTSTIDKKKIRSIDLRFGNPVVHFR